MPDWKSWTKRRVDFDVIPVNKDLNDDVDTPDLLTKTILALLITL